MSLSPPPFPTDIAAALPLWQAILATNPAQPAIWANLILAYGWLQQNEQARQTCLTALRHCPDHPDLLRHYATLCYAHGDFIQSEKSFRRVLEQSPNDARIWINLSLTLKAQHQFDEAETCCFQALTHASDSASETQARFNLANLLLRQGKWREGFAAYESRLTLPNIPACPLSLPRWTPDRPAGSRVLLWNDQGFGDAVMFVRFAAALVARQQRVFLFGQKSLKNLAALCPLIEESYYPLDNMPEMDACLPLCSLPHALALESLEGWNAPYLRAPAPQHYVFPPRTEKVRRIGLIWAGNPAHAHDAQRSMKLADFAPLFDLPHIEWYSLQIGREDEIEHSPWHHRLTHLAPFLTDFTATASLVPQLDLLISVDTAPAHLTGALGVPVWTLLSAQGTDWRWGITPATTPWYPSMRLFRQSRTGDWQPVVATVQRELTQA